MTISTISFMCVSVLTAHSKKENVGLKASQLDGYHEQAVALAENTKFATNPSNKGAVNYSMATRQLALGFGFTLGHSLRATALLFNRFLANFVFSDGATACSWYPSSSAPLHPTLSFNLCALDFVTLFNEFE